MNQDVLSKLNNLKRSGNDYTARCPAHDDRRNSLSVSEGENGRTLLYCHAGCSFEQIVAALGAGKHSGNGSQRIVATYDYTDEAAALLYQNVRFEPKDFRQRRPDGQGGFVWNLRGVRRVPFRLPVLIEAREQGALVALGEGEEDALTLMRLGFAASSFKKWQADFGAYLRGLDVVLFQDHDEAGVKQANEAAQMLSSFARSVRIVDCFASEPLPDKGGKDVSDYVKAGGTRDDLLRLIDAAAEWQPVTEATKDASLPRFTFTALDELVAEPEEETAYVVDKMLPCGGTSICAAKPKVGKSTLARYMAVCVSQGIEFLGRATAQGKVIYLCLEEKRAEVAAHFRRMGAASKDILIHTGRTPDDALEALQAAISEHSPALVIIDPLSRFVRISDFNSYAEVTRELEPLIDLARESGCHILALHHNGKGEREGGDAVLGSTGFLAAVDALLTMKKRERVRTLETLQRYGEDLPETVVRLDEGTGLISPAGDLHTLQIEEHQTKVLEALGEDCLTEGDIRERAGGNQSLVSKALRALCDAGEVLRSGAGKRGDPYQYQKSSVSRFSIYTEPRNQENRESGETLTAEESEELAALLNYYAGNEPEPTDTFEYADGKYF